MSNTNHTIELINKIEKLEEYLNEINTVMWESWGIKDRNFDRKNGEQIMKILNKWAEDK